MHGKWYRALVNMSALFGRNMLNCTKTSKKKLRINVTKNTIVETTQNFILSAIVISEGERE